MLKKFNQFIFNRFKENEARIHELTYLFWEATHRCNLNCRHCGSDCVSDSFYPDMPFEDFLNVAKEIRAEYTERPISIVIMGGEPLVRKDLAECGKALYDSGLGWGIVSNGFLYDEAKHNELLNAGMGAITLSLDGLETSHNWLRNHPKSFAKVDKALDLIINAGNRLNYDVVTCVHKKNIDELPAVRDYLIAKGCKAWRLFTISPIGRAKENDDLSLSPHQLKILLDFICDSKPNSPMTINLSCEAYLGSYELKARDSYFFCHAGVHIASVLIDGSISACPNINRNFVQGNIYKDNFLDIWQNKFKMMRDRSWTKCGSCASCKDYKNCRGGAIHLWDESRTGPITCIHNQINNLN